ncbi:MAG: sulfurtransferase TusA family protein [Rhodobacteraceae bacterium]|nr:sulfurtransferase TusA family protein [Paracoccaceae bacterium]
MQDAVPPLPLCPERTLDARGMLCPLPVLRAARALRGMRAGDLLCLLSDDPAAVVDVPHFCTQSGHEIVAQEPAEAVTPGREALRWLIRAKGGDASSEDRPQTQTEPR